MSKACSVIERGKVGLPADLQSEPATTVDRLAYTVDGAAVALSISRTTVYELFKQNRLRKVKIGRRSLVLSTDISAFLADLRGENV